jgi:hypothetical protein
MESHVIIQTNPDGSIGSLKVFINENDAHNHYSKLKRESPTVHLVWHRTDIKGFECYLETHYVVTAAIERAEDKALEEDINLFDGMGGKWQAAEEFSTEFEKKSEYRRWDGEWYDELEHFMEEKIKKQYEIAESKQ